MNFRTRFWVGFQIVTVLSLCVIIGINNEKPITDNVLYVEFGKISLWYLIGAYITSDIINTLKNK